jgi:hypothetical protein
MIACSIVSFLKSCLYDKHQTVNHQTPSGNPSVSFHVQSNMSRSYPHMPQETPLKEPMGRDVIPSIHHNKMEDNPFCAYGKCFHGRNLNCYQPKRIRRDYRRLYLRSIWLPCGRTTGLSPPSSPRLPLHLATDSLPPYTM